MQDFTENLDWSPNLAIAKCIEVGDPQEVLLSSLWNVGLAEGFR